MRSETSDAVTSSVDAASAAGLAEEDPSVVKRRKDEEELALKLAYALELVAARWNAELVAEKAGIIVASLIAITTFNGSGNLTDQELFKVAGIFYGMEFITDLLFVFIMDKYFDVPLLAADINPSGVFTKQVLIGSVIMATSFVAMGSCIKMAHMIHVG